MPKRTSPAEREAARLRKAAWRDRKKAGLIDLRLRLPKVKVREALLEIHEIGEWDDENREAMERASALVLLRKLAKVTRDIFEESSVVKESDDEF